MREVDVRLLAEGDLVDADRVMRLAFGTFLGLADPMAFLGDGDYVRSRWTADPSAALAAEATAGLSAPISPPGGAASGTSVR
ncbi:MAG: GCN5-related N-acetyltransferase [Pseudonocardiales bacterium]|nr:GCN5-related N-acetyltransferase [Pseudonocardiales bacterium]